ncbi:putative phage excisionase [Lelliottia amnigena]|uniref:excisionase family protein n=1 Tax=Lelliottia amnigena TaxID=61646 RepID=UPI0007442A96|nr:excisionase family protein [Lelliottia amnigena]ATG01242.1 DNA-binding protein [Lelliottia amnigena]PEG63418.1 DNA-binding protein [Lelliottia amnigena]QXA21538.1 excisionase family protein [Lelliottia amnigena]VDZ89184.1 putative phage excisionase [Lelliottia amnigena]
MSETTYLVINPGKWVSEDSLMALKGIKKGTLKKARENTFLEGKHYKHVSYDCEPWDNSPCFYNLDEIDKWIESQALAKSRFKSA